MTNLATVLTNTAQARPDAPALKFMGHDIGYGPLAGMAAKVAGALRENGIQPGDRVAIILPNVPAFPVVFWGILLAGGTVVPMNPLLKAGEIDYFFSDSGAKVAFVWPDFVDEATKGAANAGTRIIPCGPMGPADGTLEGGEPIAEAIERDDEDTAIILYTSGTTGRPKGAELTHRNVRLNAERSSGVILEVRPDDVVMGCLPLFHVFGLVVGLVEHLLLLALVHLGGALGRGWSRRVFAGRRACGCGCGWVKGTPGLGTSSARSAMSAGVPAHQLAAATASGRSSNTSTSAPASASATRPASISARQALRLPKPWLCSSLSSSMAGSIAQIGRACRAGSRARE